MLLDFLSGLLKLEIKGQQLLVIALYLMIFIFTGHMDDAVLPIEFSLAMIYFFSTCAIFLVSLWIIHSIIGFFVKIYGKLKE